MFEKIHERAKRDFKIKYWHEHYKKAKNHRQKTWDDIAKRCIKIRENKFPENPQLPNYEGYLGKFYKDNIIFKHIKWLTSMLTGSMVAYDLQSMTALRDENTEVLENELNMIASNLAIPQQTASALYDAFYTGMGYVRRWWDTEAVTIANKTGEPRLEHVPAMKIYIDPATSKEDKSDMNYIFHSEKMFWEDLADEYPKLKDEFYKKKDFEGLVEIITVQFKRTERIDCVTLTDIGTKPPKDWIMPVEDWKEFLNSGEEIEEGVDWSLPYKVKKSFWYEAKFFPDLEYVIKQPQYVGEFCSYHIFNCFKNSESAYDYGICYYMMDIQDINVILLTTLVLMTFKYQKPEKMVVAGSIVDEEQYLKKTSNKIGGVAVIDPSHYKNNPNAKPIDYAPQPDFPQGIMVLNEIMKNGMEDISGVNKTMTGQPQFAIMSGVAVAQHQSMGKIYHKEEQTKYQQFLSNIGRALMYDIAEYRHYAHYIQHLNIDNQQEMVLVNDPENSPYTFEPERTTVTCEIVENLEMMKQLDRELAIQLHSLGLMSGLDVLDKAGINNPNKVYERAKHEQGVNEIIRFLEENPQHMQDLYNKMNNQLVA